MRRMESAVEGETWARAEHARLLDDLEMAEGDREALMALNAELLAENDRLKAERLKLDRRIHNQRRALRENWEIIEMRASYKRAWYPSPLLKSMLNRHINRPPPWWRRVMTRALHGVSANKQFRNAS